MDEKVIQTDGAVWRLHQGCLQFAPVQTPEDCPRWWTEPDFWALTPEDVARCYEIKSLLEVVN